MKTTMFDLRQHSSTDLDRLSMGIESGIVEAKKLGLIEMVETLTSFRQIVDMSKVHAAERESDAWAAAAVQDILSLSTWKQK
jgi:hypothetical protein